MESTGPQLKESWTIEGFASLYLLDESETLVLAYGVSYLCVSTEK